MYLRHNPDYSTTLCFDYTSRHIFQFIICIMFSLFCVSMCVMFNEFSEIKQEESRRIIKEMRKRRKYTYDTDYKYIYESKQYFPKIIQRKINRTVPSSKPVSISIGNI